MNESFFRNLINASRDFLIVQAAGNDGIDAIANNFASSVIDSDIRKHLLVIGSYSTNFNDIPFRPDSVEYFISGDDKSPPSNYGPTVDIFAPGGTFSINSLKEQVISTVYDYSSNDHFKLSPHSGTSMAAPYITGLAGLLKQKFPNLSYPQIREAIIRGAVVKDKLLNKTLINTETGEVTPGHEVDFKVVDASASYDVAAQLVAHQQEEPFSPVKGFVAYYSDEEHGNRLRWNFVENAQKYKIYWGTDDSVNEHNHSGILETISTEFLHTSVVPDENYYYRISSVDADDNESELSYLIDSYVPTYHVESSSQSGETLSPLNDTGITWGGDYPSGNNPDCSGVEIGAQDCSHGRDVTHNDDSDGHAGFSFTKLDANGVPLADQQANYATTPWACVQDNVTGLIWEVKTGDGGLHNQNDAYTWYNTDPATNGGADGYADYSGNTCSGYDPGDPSTFCNTQAYVARVNAEGLCGASDWHMPTRKELQGIVSYDRYSPAIDTDYFPNTTRSVVWSGSPSANYSYNAWYVNFNNGYSGSSHRYYSFQVRLVRGGQ